MRKLASIQRISDVRPHPNADKLDICTVLGWKVVTVRGEYKVGDLCVYCEIDSIMPERPEFEFLRQRNFRIRTVKLRGELSQGICFPLTILPVYDEPYEEHLDVTDVLGVTKFEPAAQSVGEFTVKGSFPHFLQKTDETRVQNLVERDILTQYYESSRRNQGSWYVTEKLDGTSTTYFVSHGEFSVCSRNLELFDPRKEELTTRVTSPYWIPVEREKYDKTLLSLNGRNIAVQGETVGPGVQGNKLKLPQVEFFAFQVIDIDTGTMFSYDEFIEFCNKYNFKHVPIVSAEFTLTDTVDSYLEFAERKSLINPDVWAEGCVFRMKADPRTSFKAINNKFLLKFEDA